MNTSNSSMELSSFESISQRILDSAWEGLDQDIDDILSKQNKEQQIMLVNQVVVDPDDGQMFTLLHVAALNGKENVLQMLLKKYKPDMEEEGDIEFQGQLIEGASPLLLAAAFGHFKAVRILVKAGAVVNHSDKNLTTPLLAASSCGNLDVVKYLIEHKADIDLVNKDKYTCLMVASRDGNLEVVKYLLEKGADPNQKSANAGYTALHFSAEKGHVDIVRELLNSGAQITKNDQGMTPLLCAALSTQPDVVECLVTRTKFDRKERRIEALELLGASFVNDYENYSLDKAYRYLHRAMKKRFTKSVMLKPIASPIEAYQNWRETQTRSELEAIRYDANAIHMESLVILQRILGTESPALLNAINFQAVFFYRDELFDNCIPLWLHALRLRQCMLRPAYAKYQLRLCHVFSEMLVRGLEVSLEVLEQVLFYSVTELELYQSKIANPVPDDDVTVIAKQMGMNVLTALYLVTIATKVLPKATPQQERDVCKHIHQISRLNVRTQEGSSLLHLAASFDTPVADFIADVCRYPCASTCKLLIQCGFDANSMDHERNTPLHLIVAHPDSMKDVETLQRIIETLTEAGVHMDAVNDSGMTASHIANKNGLFEEMLRKRTKLSLQCLAARVIKNHSISCKGLVPVSLEEFIELHGPGTTKRPYCSRKEDCCMACKQRAYDLAFD